MARPRARTRNVADKKQRIVAAAQALFSDQGYGQTSVKDVADRADVSPALVIRHFGSKRELFRQALVDALEHPTVAGIAKASFGGDLCAQIVEGAGGVRSPSMIALSLSDPEARSVAAEVARTHILEPTAEWIDGPDGMPRAAYIMILSMGLALFKRLYEDGPPLDAQAPPTRWTAASIQAAVDGTPGAPR